MKKPKNLMGVIKVMAKPVKGSNSNQRPSNQRTKPLMGPNMNFKTSPNKGK